MNKTAIRQSLAFVLISLCLSAAIYRDALWGGSLLAPLDIGPTLFEHYRFMDPAAGNVPENHHIIDQFTYDLPLQKVIYDAYHAGEIPWWDPWTYGGRPLLADAHVNGTDPIRVLCYASLPFELAYNWNLILRGILTGLGMFLLLRYIQTALFPAVFLALTYQFAGWFTVFWGHPWIQGSFVYYPYIWLIWQRCTQGDWGRFALYAAIGAVLAALVFLAGNLQSHAYLPVFGACFLAATFFTKRDAFVRAFCVIASTGLIGALLAAPVLANQIEFYLLSVRSNGVAPGIFQALAGILSPFLSLHPWPGGDFKTIGFARGLLGVDGFILFAGGALGIFALFAMASRRYWRDHLMLTAILLLLSYILVICTPLRPILYHRVAPLAGMGMVVLAARCWESRPSVAGLLPICRKLALLIPVLLVLWTTVLYLVFPKVEAKLAARAAATAESESSGSTLALRQSQVKQTTNRVTLHNPAASTGAAGLCMALASLGWTNHKRVNTIRNGSILFGTASTLIFHSQFVPLHDVRLLQKLVEGGQAQKEIIAHTRPGQRIDESNVGLRKCVFPNAFPAFYRMHAVQGYSALQPLSLLRVPIGFSQIPCDWTADFVRTREGPFVKVHGTSPSRFRDGNSKDGLAVETLVESHNRLQITLQNPASSILRTDTNYPGWRVEGGASVPLPGYMAPIFSLYQFPQTVRMACFTYQPNWFPVTLTASLAGGFVCIGLFLYDLARGSVFTRNPSMPGVDL